MSKDIENLNKLFGISSNDDIDPKKLKKPKDIENLDRMFGINDDISKNIDSKYSTIFKDSKKNINIDLTNRDYISEYDDPFNTDGGLTDLNELRANRQSWGSKAGSGVGRIAAKVTAEVAKMPGVIAGIIASPFAAENEGFETAFNNSWIKTINNLNEDFNTDVLPVYVKKAVSEGNLWDNISSIDFWATEGADGIGYIASMMAPGAALKGLGVGNQLSKLRALRGVVSAQKADVITATLANTLFEAGAEAGNAMENFQKEMDRKIGSGEITIEEYDELNQQKALLGRDIFLANSVILLGPNALQANMLWGKGLSKTASKIVDSEGKLLKTVVEPKWYQKVLNRGKDVLKAAGSEGIIEEAGQMTVENMFTDSAKKGQLGNNPLNDFNISELGNAYLDTITSTEGQKAMFLGAFLGGGMQAYQGAKTDQAGRKQTQSLLDVGGNAIDAFYKTMTADMYDEAGKPIPEKVKEKMEAFGQIEQLNILYNDAVQKQDKEALEKLRDLAATQLAYGFIMNEDLGLDVLQQHLEASSEFDEIVQREQDAGNKTTKKDIIENVMSKAKVLEKSYRNFNDFAPSLVNPTLKEGQTKEDVQNFTNTLRGKYISNKANINLISQTLEKLKKQKSEILEDLNVDDLNSEMNQGITSTDERLLAVNKDIEETSTNLERLKKLDRNFWNKDHLQKAFDKTTKESKKLKEETSPEKVLTADETLNKINNVTTLEELEDIDLLNNVVLAKSYNAKKAELEEVVRKQREDQVAQDTSDANNQDVDKTVNTETVKSYSKNNEINDIVIDPFTGEESTIESISKNSIGLRNNTTNQSFIYEFEEDVTDTNSADDIDITTINPVTPGTTQSDHKSVGYDNNNPSFGEYLMEPRDKKGDVVTFELNKDVTTTQETAKAIEIVEKRDNLAGNRQFLIDHLPINFIYNNGQAKSWSSFKGPNAVKLRTNIVDALIQGAKLEDLKTVITNQETPSFNTKFENGKPVKNNPLDLEFVKSLDNSNPENKVTLYHINSEGKLILVSGNKNPMLLTLTKTLESQKGQIFIGIKNPKGDNIPVKLNFSKLNEVKASTLAQIYGEILKDETVRNKSLIQLKAINLELFNEINKTLATEVELLGNNPATINIANLIELLVYENSFNDKSIDFKQQESGNTIEFNGKIFDVNNIDELGVELKEKYHNVNTLATDSTLNKKLIFTNPIYLKYLFDNGIVSTNLNIEGSAFKQSTDTKAVDKNKNKGSELWISSAIENTNAKPATQSKTLTVKEVFDIKLKEFNIKIAGILAKRKEGQDSVTAKEFMMDTNGKFIEFEDVVYNEEGIITEDGLVTYNILKDELKETVKNNLSSISKSIQPAVTQPTTTTSKPQQSEIEAKKAENIVTASFTGQGTTLEIEIKGEKKDFLLTWNRNNTNPTLWGNKKEDGSYTTTDTFPSKEDVQKLVDKYIPSKLLNLINEWTNASKLPAEKVLDAQAIIETKINAELKALESENNLENNVQIIEYNNNSYSVNLDKGTIKNTKTGKEIQGSSPVGKKVLDLVNWDGENNLEKIRNSQENSVSLPKDNITMVNKSDIEGTPEYKDYKEAFKKLEVTGDNLVQQEKLEKVLNKANSTVEQMKKLNKPDMVAKFEKIAKEAEQDLIKLAEKIKENKKC